MAFTDGRPLRRLVALAVLALLPCTAAGLASSTASAATEACPPPPPTASVPPPAVPTPAPTSPAQTSAEQLVACVASQPITTATFTHWGNIARKAGGSHPPSAGEVLNEVMGFLISSYWVIDEALALNVHVSAAEVRHNFDHIRGQQFPHHGEFQQFLRESGQTVADLLFRVKLNLLSNRIQERVVAGHHSATSQQRALARFVHEFKRKWQAQTYCAPAYAVSDCGQAQADL